MTVRIEDITPEAARGLDDRDLQNARSRAVQMYERTELGRSALRKRTVGVTQPIGRDDFMAAYGAVVGEMAARGIDWRPTDLDAKLTRKAVRGVDVAELPPITLREGAVWLTGGFVADPKRAATVGVWLDSAGYPQELEQRMVEALLAQTDRDVAVVDELIAPGIPAYDLVLMPRAETRDTDQVAEFAKRRGGPIVAEPADWPALLAQARAAWEAVERGIYENTSDLEKRFDEALDVGLGMIHISKPFVNEHAARQLEPGQFQDFRRENDKFGAGIHAIWGITADGKAKLQSIRFSAGRFTAAEAGAWLKEHDYKTTVEAAVEKYDPDQSREPAGSPEGEQFAGGGGGGAGGEGGGGLGGSPGGRESYNDRIEGTPREADREVFRAERGVDKAKAALLDEIVESASGGKAKAISGEFCKVDDEERVVAGVVYAPDEVDAQGDWTDAGEIWKALKRYMIETGGIMKIMHEGRAVDAPVVEVFQAEADTVKGGTTIPAGAWYQANYIPSGMDDVWRAIKAGDLKGYSMAGHAEEEEEEERGGV